MENVKIIGCGYAYGSNCVTNDMLKNVVDTSDEWIQSRTGIKQRTVSENENTSDLAIRAAKKAIEENHIDKHQISLIIVATCTPDNVTPSCACLVQEALGLMRIPSWLLISMQHVVDLFMHYSVLLECWIKV